MPDPSFTPPPFELYAGRTVDYQLELYEAVPADEDEDAPELVLAATDVVRAKLWIEGGEGSAPALDIDSIGDASMDFTADAGTDVCTVASDHGLVNANIVTVTNSGGALPAGLSAGTNYYVISATATTFKVSLTEGGGAVDITDAGTGTHTFHRHASIVTIDDVGVADTSPATVTVRFHQNDTVDLAAGFYVFECAVVDDSDLDAIKPVCRTTVEVKGSGTGDLGLT